MDGVLHIAIPHCTLNVTGNASLQAPSLPHGIAHLGTRLAYLAGGKCYIVTCYMLHVTISTFRMSAPSFGSLNLGGVKII